MPQMSSATASQPRPHQSLLEEVADELRKEWEDLTTVHYLVSRLEEEICNQLPPGMDPDATGGSPISQALDELEEIVRIIEVARVSPDLLPAPEPCGLVGEATVRARLGVKVAATHCSAMIVDKLKNMLKQSTLAHTSTLKISVACEQIGATLRGCASRVSTTLSNCEALSDSLRHLADDEPAVLDTSVILSLRRRLEHAQFTNCLQRLADVAQDLDPVIKAVRKQTGAMREFTNRSSQEVEDAFELSFPMSLVQSILIGEAPPMRRVLLRRLNKLSEVNNSPLEEALRRISKNIAELQVGAAQDSLQTFISRAHECLDKLDAHADMATPEANPPPKMASTVLSPPVLEKIVDLDEQLDLLECNENADDQVCGPDDGPEPESILEEIMPLSPSKDSGCMVEVDQATSEAGATEISVVDERQPREQDGQPQVDQDGTTITKIVDVLRWDDFAVPSPESKRPAISPVPLSDETLQIPMRLHSVSDANSEVEGALVESQLSPKLIEDQVSASLLQETKRMMDVEETFVNFSPEVTATPCSEEPLSASPMSSDCHADEPSLEEQAGGTFLREASEGDGL